MKNDTNPFLRLGSCDESSLAAFLSKLLGLLWMTENLHRHFPNEVIFLWMWRGLGDSVFPKAITGDILRKQSNVIISQGTKVICKMVTDSWQKHTLWLYKIGTLSVFMETLEKLRGMQKETREKTSSPKFFIPAVVQLSKLFTTGSWRNGAASTLSKTQRACYWLFGITATKTILQKSVTAIQSPQKQAVHSHDLWLGTENVFQLCLLLFYS